MPLDAARWQIDILAADKTAQAFASAERRLKSLEVAQGRMAQAAVTQFMTAAKGALAFTAALIAVERIMSAGFEIGSLGDQATQLNLTTDQLQAYRLAAAQAGVEAGNLDKALQTLNAQMYAAQQGDDAAIARFEKLGVKILDANGKLRPLAATIPEVSRGLLEMGNETERNGLAQELLSRSGARTVTMLEAWAKGNDALIAKTREMNALASGDTIKAWNAIESQFKVLDQQYKTLIATFALPIAMTELRKLQAALGAISWSVDKVVQGWQWMTSGVPAGDLQKRADTIMATIDAMTSGASGELDDIAKARLRGLWAEWTKLQQDIAAQQTAAFDVPPIVVTSSGGARNPTGDKASKAGAKLDERLKELQNERAALEKALAAFDARGNETVAEVDRRLDAQVKLDKKIFDVLKDVPPNSPLAGRLIQEATAVSQLNTKLDERKRLLTEGEEVTARHGDGTRVFAREMERLNQLLAAGAITQGTYANAVRATTQAADDQARAYRGAAGGIDGFRAGIEQGLANMERANSAFMMGQRLVDELSDAITDLATGAEVDFGRILQSFLGMIIQMEMRAMASNVWNMITGKGPTDQGIGGMLAGLFKGGGGDFFSAGPIAVDGIPTIALAGGGRYEAGVPRITGEDGWELDVPDHGGTVYNQDQLRAMLGSDEGGTRVAVYQTVQVGSVVSQAQHERDLMRVREEARAGAIAGVLDAKSRGGDYRGVFKR